MTSLSQKYLKAIAVVNKCILTVALLHEFLWVAFNNSFFSTTKLNLLSLVYLRVEMIRLRHTWNN